MTLPSIDKARAMGSEAFTHSAVRLCPIAPPTGHAVGDVWSGVAHAWYQGWDAANIAAPVPDDVCHYCSKPMAAACPGGSEQVGEPICCTCSKSLRDDAHAVFNACKCPSATAPSCVHCHRVVTGGSMIDGRWVCRDCWYDGAVLAENLAPFIALLNHVTGYGWEPVRTGGGCFGIAATVDFARDPIQRQLMISFAEGPFAGDTALTEIAGGLMLGLYDVGTGDLILTRVALSADGIPSIQIALYALDIIKERNA